MTLDIDEFKASLADRDLIGLDSEYTYSTRMLVNQFNATGAHLNCWWVRTSVDWVCPACRRRKSEIVRLNNRNYLICHLHAHHDHMRDIVKELFEKYSLKQKVVVADETSERFATKAAFSLSAYDNTVICFDCNKSEGDAKGLVGTHKYFSFSPDEIRSFVKPAHNQPHEIDVVAATNAWERAKDTFSTRLEYAKQLARIAAEKKDWYRPSERSAKQIERMAKYHYKTNKLLEIEPYNPETLLYTADPFRGEENSWRQNRKQFSGQLPTEKEIAHLASVRGSFWKRYEETWICPCCSRSKFQCVRRSNKKNWMFEAKSSSLFDIEEQTTITQSSPMCTDCLDTAIHIGREAVKKTAVDISFPSSVISLSELRKIVIPVPHGKHQLNTDIIESIMPTLCVRARMIETRELEGRRSIYNNWGEAQS